MIEMLNILIDISNSYKIFYTMLGKDICFRKRENLQLISWLRNNDNKTLHNYIKTKIGYI